MKPTTQTQAVLELFKKGRTLDLVSCFKETGCSSVARRVSDFRKMGYVFKTTTQTFKTRYGTKGRVKYYTLDFKNTSKKLIK
jgi:hypothetical protein